MSTPGALDGLRVLDLSRILAGPWASQVLADLGADVIKVERPGSGDDTRHWGPPWLKDEEGEPTRHAAYFLAANRGKRSVCIDIRSPGGQRAVRELARESDILIENFRTGALAKYRLDYAALNALNPGLVYCSITGFGHTGPYADRPGYDALIQAMGGLMSITGERDGEPGGGPQKIGVALSDVMAGLYAAIGILAAVHERRASGKGQHIDLSLLDVTAAALANQAVNYLVGGVVPERMGSAHPSIVPYQNFRTADGHCMIAVGNDRQFGRLARMLGKPEWAGDKRFADNAARVAHRETLIPMIQDILSLEPTEHWLQQFETYSVPGGPINSIANVFSDPQILARDMRVRMDHPAGGSIELPGNPLRMSRTPPSYRRPPPGLGEHDDEILAGLRGGSAD